MTTDPSAAAGSQADPTEPTNPQPQAGVTTPPEPQAGDGQATPNDSISLDEAKKLRQEANALRKRLKAYDDAKAEAEQAQLTETERLKKQLADKEVELANVAKAAKADKLNAEVRVQAMSLGFADPSDAATFMATAAIEYDEQGAPTNVKDLLQALLKAKPYLGGKAAPQPATGGGATNPSKSQSSAPVALTRESIAKMASERPEEYTARRAEIQAWLAAHPWRYGQS